MDNLIGFQIEGASLGAEYPGGVVFHADVGTYEIDDAIWVDAMLDRPASVSSAVNPYTGEATTSAYTIELSWSPRLMRLFFHEQRYASGRLTSFASNTSTTIDYGVSGLDGEVVWIDDEAIVLGTYGSGQYAGCTRGACGTRAAYHAADAYVFEGATPYWETRVVTLLDHNLDTGVTTVRWRGLVRDIETSDDGEHIVITTEEYLTALSRAQLNHDAIDLTPTLAHAASGRSQLQGVRRRVSVSGDMSIQLDSQAVIYAPYATTTRTVELPELSGGYGLYGSRYDYDEGEAPGAIWEVCTLENFANLDYPTHPLAIALALIVSTGGAQGVSGVDAYKVLGQSWGLGFDVIDLTSWEAEIAAAPDLSIDQLVLGLDGQLVDVIPVIRQKLLRPFGYFMTVTQDGSIGLGRLRLLDIRDWQAAQDNQTTIYPDGPLKWRRAMGSTVQRVVAEVGGLPWQSSRKVTLLDGSRSSRRALLGDSRDLTLDFSVVSASRLQVTSREDSELANALANLLQIMLDAVPRIRVRTPDTTQSDTLASLNLGDVVVVPDLEIEGGWAIDADGEILEDTSNVDFAGLVIERNLNLDTMSYDLELLLTNFRVQDYIRLRAPSARVLAYNSGSQEFTCDANWYTNGPTCEERFHTGDEVVLDSRQGVTASVVMGITSLSPSVIQVDTPPGVAVTAGQILRLANSNDYSNDTIYGVTIRPYAYLSDDGALFTDGNGDDAGPDLYGTQVYGGAS